MRNVSERPRISQGNDFYKEYREVNPAIILAFIVVSAGVYILNWIYFQTKELGKMTENAPDKNRCAVVMVLAPLILTVATFIERIYFFHLYPEFLLFIEISVWLVLVALMFKYIYDFCSAFAEVTKTNNLVWFFLIVIGAIGVVGIIFKSLLIGPFAFFLAITIPAMQEELNHKYHKSSMETNSNAYYDC